MKFDILLPSIMIIEQLLAALVYIYYKDFNKAGYFISGSLITYFAMKM